MQRESVGEVIARIEGARRAEHGGVVAFDCDGTLWSGDVGEDFFHALLALARFSPVAHAEMKLAAREFKVTASGDATALATKLYAEYVEKRFPEVRIFELMAWGCAGWRRNEVADFARKVIADARLAARMHKEALSVLEWAKDAGIEVFLVSASPRVVIEEAAMRLGIDGDHVVAATPLYDGDTMRAAVDRPIPYGPGKVTRLRERVGKRKLYAAFGDNLFDVPMLREAVVPVAVRPKPRLAERAADVDRLVEIAPI